MTENQTVDPLKEAVQQIAQEFYGPHDFVQTSPCGRGQHHPHGLVGRLWRINDPRTVRVGNCFLEGRLKKGDLFLCVKHSGDCFQDYIYVEEYANGLRGRPQWAFGSYGIGDAEPTDIPADEFVVLKTGGTVKRDTGPGNTFG